MPSHPDGDSESESSPHEPVSSFQSLFAEGDILAKQGGFYKAIEAYTKALELRPGEKNCLVARSKCNLQLGDSESALQDANDSLKQDPLFFKGVFYKAEALYAKGDFEMALVFFHRGNKMRPELDEFRLGIQKAREAIDNSIGNPKDYKFQAPAGIKITPQGLFMTVPTSGPGGIKATHQAAAKDRPISGKNMKQLLGELYTDREYLEHFLIDKDFEQNPNDDILSLVKDALGYLETRTEFWRQQKPIYARRKEHSKILIKEIAERNKAFIAEKVQDHKIKEALTADQITLKSSVLRPISAETPHKNRFTVENLKYVNASMNVVTRSVNKGDFQRALNAARSLLTRLEGMKNLPNVEKAISDATSIMGNIYLDLGSLPQAMLFFRRDLQHCRANDLEDSTSRALGNMGRIYVKLRKFDEAITVFEQKLVIESKNTVDSPTIEQAWLLHDVGRCHLEMNRDIQAKEMGEASLAAAVHCKNERWCLNASVLIGQVEVRNNHIEAAEKIYSKALLFAKALEDAQALEAISDALKQLNRNSESEPRQNRLTEHEHIQIKLPQAVKQNFPPQIPKPILSR
ncbi:Tetratricopeptide repeat protein 25 [Physocladia obscura]|uniref:Outer dynein arm-docking complex subunit 4 n=1 Tax=Physocladia obscura TaxID=109957 RepID=A0AAD5T7B9_9FUNG|nr:Tetratricopeptide repeat protein 25 [Physocladia obscura]